MVCIEISIPNIPKAVQHQIVRTRIDGDCSNEASHALNMSELGGGHIKMQLWNAHNCPYISVWLQMCHVTFRGGSVDIMCLSLGSKVPHQTVCPGVTD